MVVRLDDSSIPLGCALGAINFNSVTQQNYWSGQQNLLPILVVSPSLHQLNQVRPLCGHGLAVLVPLLK